MQIKVENKSPQYSKSCINNYKIDAKRMLHTADKVLSYTFSLLFTKQLLR